MNRADVRSVIAATSRNHDQSIACAARRHGLRAVIATAHHDDS